MSGPDLSDTTGSFAELVAAGTPTPGGGSVAAYSGLLAASLGRMMCNLTLGKPKYAGVEPEVKEIKEGLERLGARLTDLIAEDAASFDRVMAAYRMPKETDEQRAERKRQIDRATLGAARVPLETAGAALEVMKLLAKLSEIGNYNALPDIATGSQLARAGMKGAYYNIGVNLKTLSDAGAAGRMRLEIINLIEEAERLAARIEAVMLGQM